MHPMPTADCGIMLPICLYSRRCCCGCCFPLLLSIISVPLQLQAPRRAEARVVAQSAATAALPHKASKALSALPALPAST